MIFSFFLADHHPTDPANDLSCGQTAVHHSRATSCHPLYVIALNSGGIVLSVEVSSILLYEIFHSHFHNKFYTLVFLFYTKDCKERNINIDT